MRNDAQPKGIARAAVSALAALLVLTPVCGAHCQFRNCDLLRSAAGGSCHEIRMVSGDATRILTSAAFCSGRELPAALPAESRPQPVKQLLTDHLAAVPAAPPDPLQVPEGDAGDFLRRHGPLPRGAALRSTVLRN